MNKTSMGGAVKPDTSQASVKQTNENAFTDLRNMALSATPQQLGISFADNKVQVYGVVMDWGMDGNTATLAAYQTGDASLYLSNGGGVIGGGQHESVSQVTKQYIANAQSVFVHAAKVENTAMLPAENEVIFYLLTNDGIYAGRDSINNFDNASSVWLPLFSKANDVITEIRQLGY